MNQHLLPNLVDNKINKAIKLDPKVKTRYFSLCNCIEERKAIEPTPSASVEEDIANGNDDECYLCEGN